MTALAVLVVAVQPVLAQPGDTDREQRAADLYQKGARLLQDRKPAEALVELDASLALSPGPNTALVRAHALRLLGRRAEAMTAYTEVARDAGDRVRGGDDRARETLADAGRWTALLRAELGEVSVEIGGAPAGLALTIDDRPTTVTRDADGVARARLWHEPGRARVSARAPGGEERSSTAEVTAGGVASVRLDLAPAPGPSSGPPLGTWITWGAGAASLGVFAVFGGMALSVSSRLDACSPACPESLRADASTGARDSMIANVALGIGAAGFAAGAVLWVVTPRRAPAAAIARRPAIAPARAFVTLTPGGGSLGLTGTF